MPPLRFDASLRNATSDGTSVGVNPVWMQRALGDGCSGDVQRRAAILGILAHELGHHHEPDPSPDRWMRERYADAVAGFVLARSGASIEPMLAVLATLPFSANHPPHAERRRCLGLGWGYGAAGRPPACHPDAA